MKYVAVVLFAVFIGGGCASLRPDDSNDVHVAIDQAGMVKVSNPSKKHWGEFVALQHLPKEMTSAGAKRSDVIWVGYSSGRVNEEKVKATLHALIDAGYFNLWTWPK